MRPLFTVLIFLSCAAFGQGASPAAPISLKQAVEIALEKNPLRKATIADTRAAAAGVKEAQSALLPHIVFSETAMRGNDPVYAFGTRLRQHRFAAADFALNRLNTPDPIGNFSTRFSGQWNLLDSFATYKNIGRARDMKAASSHQLESSDQEIIFQVVEAYYSLLLKLREEEVAEQPTKTANAMLERTKNRFESGLAVQSDFLSSQVNAAQREQQLIAASNAVATARAELSNALGLGTVDEWQPEPISEAPLPAESRDELERRAITDRADLKRIASEQAAQDKSVAAVKSTFGPRLNVFAGWEADNPTVLAAGGGNNWTGGVELQFDLFSGGQKIARLAREKALRDRLAAMRRAAENAVRLEVRSAYYDADTARRQVDVARGAAEQARESLRINQNRYDSGLATITDLLRVEEASHRAQADYWSALYRYRTSYARLQLATGSLTTSSPVVTQ